MRALVLLCITLVGALPAWSIPGWHGTEGRRVQIALEMLRSSDWMIPTIGGQPTWAKPPLHYWLLATCGHWFGESTWSMRLPSVLLAFFAAWFAMELMRPWFGRCAGWMAALGIALSPLVLVEWPTAEIDPVFASLTAMSLWSLATGIGRQRGLLVVASGVLGGLAFLQKGPPYFMFAAGAYLVWWRHRGLRHAWWHFGPLVAVGLAYYVPLWAMRITPSEMLGVVGEETVGRIAYFEWEHFAAIPGFWLRAVAVQAPFVFWCFWEWRGARDARMDAGDLTLRMCSGAAVVAVVVLTFFPGRPTRYLLPNVLLFTFAVAPAVAHFALRRGELGSLARGAVTVVGAAGALALMGIPFVPGLGVGAMGLALAAGLAPLLVRTPRQLVACCLLLPLVAAWEVGCERATAWEESPRAREPGARVLRRELERLGAIEQIVTFGHVDAPLLLGAGLLPTGDETARSQPLARWVLREAESVPASPAGYVDTLRLCLPSKTFVVSERTAAPR